MEEEKEFPENEQENETNETENSDNNKQQETDDTNQFKQRLDLSGLEESVQKVKNEIGKVIVGQEKIIDLIIAAVLAKGHVLLEGVPGVAKTLTAKLISRAIDTDFKRIQFTPDLMPSDVLGTTVYNPETREFELRKGPIFTNIALIDEINRAPAKTQAALFEVMEEQQITIDNYRNILPHPFMVIATQNPVEHEGTYNLPEAQLDRFLFKIIFDYPKIEEEVNILRRKNTLGNKIETEQINKILSAEEILKHREKISKVICDDSILEYIAKIIATTRNHPSIFLGASPRAGISLMNASKAFAAMNGRDFVTPEDILFMVKPVLRHRLILTPEKELDGSNIDDIIISISKSIEVPR